MGVGDYFQRLEYEFNTITTLIKQNKYSTLKNFINKYNIKLKDYYQFLDTFDFLIYAIYQKASIDIIDYIINNLNLYTLNYVHVGTTFNTTPLSCVIETKNSELIRYFLKK